MKFLVDNYHPLQIVFALANVPLDRACSTEAASARPTGRSAFRLRTCPTPRTKRSAPIWSSVAETALVRWQSTGMKRECGRPCPDGGDRSEPDAATATRRTKQTSRLLRRRSSSKPCAEQPSRSPKISKGRSVRSRAWRCARAPRAPRKRAVQGRRPRAQRRSHLPDSAKRVSSGAPHRAGSGRAGPGKSLCTRGGASYARTRPLHGIGR